MLKILLVVNNHYLEYQAEILSSPGAVEISWSPGLISTSISCCSKGAESFSSSLVSGCSWGETTSSSFSGASSFCWVGEPLSFSSSGVSFWSQEELSIFTVGISVCRLSSPFVSGAVSLSSSLVSGIAACCSWSRYLSRAISYNLLASAGPVCSTSLENRPRGFPSKI